ncbi:hypothetical protein V6U90_22255 [Micromonospora sp. CPCC 206060]|uniref:WXG100-like domain-containing protein n=1 Tax=Micromonospora sp. CPCC 206060 TaxID=3122406 RepID=UPI002FEFD057
MGMEIPDWVRTMFLITTGESWPEADEDQLRALSTAWNQFATQLGDTETTIRAARQGVTTSWTGQGADAFTTRLDQLIDTGHIKALRDTSTNLTTYTNQAALNVEYAKMMIIGQLGILISNIIYLTWLLATPAAPAAAPAIAALQTLGRHIATQILGQLAKSLAVNLFYQVGLDIAVQTAQTARQHRTEWDNDRTGGATLGGLSTLTQHLATRSGITITNQVAKNVAEFTNTVGQSALHEYSAEAAADLILNGRREAPAGWAATAGATEGILDWGKDRARARGANGTSTGLPGLGPTIPTLTAPSSDTGSQPTPAAAGSPGSQITTASRAPTPGSVSALVPVPVPINTGNGNGQLQAGTATNTTPTPESVPMPAPAPALVPINTGSSTGDGGLTDTSNANAAGTSGGNTITGALITASGPDPGATTSSTSTEALLITPGIHGIREVLSPTYPTGTLTPDALDSPGPHHPATTTDNAVYTGTPANEAGSTAATSHLEDTPDTPAAAPPSSIPTGSTSTDDATGASPTPPPSVGSTSSYHTLTQETTTTQSSNLRYLTTQAGHMYQTPMLLVRAGMVVHVEAEAVNRQGGVSYGQGTVRTSFRLSDAVEVLMTPDLALREDLEHPHGFRTRSGFYLPSEEVRSDRSDNPEAVRRRADELAAAYSLRPVENALVVHVAAATGPEGGVLLQVNGTQLTAEGFHDRVLRHHDVAGKTVVLVGSHLATPGPQGEPSPAAELARRTGRPVVAAPSDVHTTPDGHVLAATPGVNRGGQPMLVRRDRWQIVQPDGTTTPAVTDLEASLRQAGLEVSDQPDHALPPREPVRWGQPGPEPTGVRTPPMPPTADPPVPPTAEPPVDRVDAGRSTDRPEPELELEPQPQPQPGRRTESARSIKDILDPAGTGGDRPTPSDGPDAGRSGD